MPLLYELTNVLTCGKLYTIFEIDLFIFNLKSGI
jgi:hypothetical protein